MKRITNYFIICIICVMIMNAFNIPASAACIHSFGPQYSEAAHPHQYFSQCNLCGYTKYVPCAYATKAHGNGSWGSGTCPSCGTHTYVGKAAHQAECVLVAQLLAPMGTPTIVHIAMQRIHIETLNYVRAAIVNHI